MRFKEYLGEKQKPTQKISLDSLYIGRKEVMKQMRKLKTYIHPKDKALYTRAIKLVDPNNYLKKIIKNIEKENQIQEGKEDEVRAGLQEVSNNLIFIIDNMLYIDCLSTQNEMLLKNDFENIAEALSIVAYVRIDEKYIEHFDEIKQQLFGESDEEIVFGIALGALIGGVMMGPFGGLLGMFVGGILGDVNFYSKTAQGLKSVAEIVKVSINSAVKATKTSIKTYKKLKRKYGEVKAAMELEKMQQTVLQSEREKLKKDIMLVYKKRKCS